MKRKGRKKLIPKITIVSILTLCMLLSFTHLSFAATDGYYPNTRLSFIPEYSPSENGECIQYYIAYPSDFQLGSIFIGGVAGAYLGKNAWAAGAGAVAGAYSVTKYDTWFSVSVYRRVHNGVAELRVETLRKTQSKDTGQWVVYNYNPGTWELESLYISIYSSGFELREY